MSIQNFKRSIQATIPKDDPPTKSKNTPVDFNVNKYFQLIFLPTQQVNKN